MSADTVALLAIAALQGLSLWVLSDLRSRVVRLEDSAMQINANGCAKWGPMCASWEQAVKRLSAS